MHDIFRSMKEQMAPGEGAKAALTEQLAQPIRSKSRSWRKYAALAACLALVVTAVPVSQALRAANDPPRQHSYTTVDGYFRLMVEEKHPIDGGGGRDSAHAKDSIDSIGVLDAPVQEEGADAYQSLMVHFDGVYPDWYGGSYINDRGSLTVLLVDSENPEDKSLELQVIDWAGSGNISFTSAQYSYHHLNELMVSLNTLMDSYDGFATWSVNEAENRIDLDISFQANTQLLTALAELDPADNAIRLRVFPAGAAPIEKPAENSQAQKGPAPGGVTTPAEQPVPVVIGDDVDGDPDGYHYDKQPIELPIPEPLDETGVPAHYDLLPPDTAE